MKMHTFYELQVRFPFVQRMENVRCGTLLMLENDNKMLVVKEKRRMDYGKKYKSTWGIPKGRLQIQDSSLLAAARRELQEETGIAINSDDYLYPYIVIPNIADKSAFVIFPARLRDVQSIRINDEEIADAKWLTLKEFARLPGNRVSNFMWQTIDVLRTLLDAHGDAPDDSHDGASDDTKRTA